MPDHKLIREHKHLRIFGSMLHDPNLFHLNRRSVAGAFAVRRRHHFNNRKICLIDDIKTTGATLNECAKTLKEAGASKVFALVLAVAGQNIT